MAPELSLNLLDPFCLAATQRVHQLGWPEVANRGEEKVVISRNGHGEISSFQSKSTELLAPIQKVSVR